MKIINDQEVINKLMADTFGLDVDVYLKYLKQQSDIKVPSTQNSKYEKLITDILHKLGCLKSRDEVYMVPNNNSLAVIAVSKIFNKICIMYNTDWLDHMDEKHIHGYCVFVNAMTNMIKSKRLVIKNPSKGEFIFDGRNITHTAIESVNSTFESLSPWKKECIKKQCEYLGIRKTNDMAQLVGMVDILFGEVYDKIYKRHLAFQSKHRVNLRNLATN